jgi:hypothetical protein
MAKNYRTANGGKVDLGALILSNENTRSVGNMGVNARGDRVNSRNEVVETRNEIVQTQYNRAHSNVVQDAPIPTSARHAEEIVRQEAKDLKRSLSETPKTKKVTPKVKKVKEEILPVATETVETVVENPVIAPVVETARPVTAGLEQKSVQQEPVVSVNKNTVPQGGLAAAIARAKEIKEEQMKTPRQLEQEKKGVTKL